MTQAAGDAPETISRSLQATRAASVAISAIVLCAQHNRTSDPATSSAPVATWLETDTAPTDVEEQHFGALSGDESARIAYPNESGDYVDVAGSTDTGRRWRDFELSHCGR